MQPRTAAAEIEACLEDQDLQGAWFKTNLWLKHRGDKAFRPSFEDMTRLTDEMEDMHKRVDPQEEPIPTLIAPYEIDDSVPTEDEITLAVKRLKSGKSPVKYMWIGYIFSVPLVTSSMTGLDLQRPCQVISMLFFGY